MCDKRELPLKQYVRFEEEMRVGWTNQDGCRGQDVVG